MSRPTFPLAIALATLTLAECGGGGRLSVGWRLASGRDCANAGVATIALDGPVSCQCGDAGNACDCRFTCQDGESGKAVEVTLTREGTVTAAGISPEGNVLYRGEAEAKSGAPLTIDLYFTGGR